MSGNAIVPTTREGFQALRESGSDEYWSPAVQSAELSLVEAEHRSEAKALASIKRLENELADPTTLTTTFDELPPAVIEAVGAELLGGLPTWPPPAGWEAEQNFKSLEEGKQLWREWGDTAPHKLAIVRERMWRIKERLSDADDAALGEVVQRARK